MGYVRYSSFVSLLQERAISHPDQIIFTFLGDGENESDYLTYHQLDQQARAIAHKLQSRKAKGERALLLYQPGLEFVTAFLGCLYAGVIATPAYPPRANRSYTRLSAIIKDAGALFALTTQSLKEKIEQKLTKNNDITCLTTDDISPSIAQDWQTEQIKSEETAFLQYTSGSTGTPKGVIVSHGNLIHNSQLIKDYFHNDEHCIGSFWLPPYHDMGLIGGILQPIYSRFHTIMLPPVTFLQRPIRWLRAISKYKVTTAGGPNFAYEMCVNSISEKQKEDLDLSHWQLAFSGAEPVRAETITKFSRYFADCGFKEKSFYPCYGMAETTLIVSGGNPDNSPTIKNISATKLQENEIIFNPEDTADIQKVVSSGHISSQLEVQIVNPDTLVECPNNKVGEIWVKGESVAQGYWLKKELTKKTFQASTANGKKKGFLRTGDLGFVNDGELFVTGRLKDLIIIRGRNHYPQDIEESVGNIHEAINSESGASFAIEKDNDEHLIVIFEVKRTFLQKLKQDDNLQREIFDAVRKVIAENHELQVYSIVLIRTGSIPKTSSGKIARYACRKEFLEGNLPIVAQWNLDNIYNRQKTSYTKNINRIKKTISINNKNINKNTLKIQQWLKNNLANRLQVSPSVIDIEQPFINYGLDSVQAVQLTADLEDYLECKLSPTLAYDYPNIVSLSFYLSELKNDGILDLEIEDKNDKNIEQIAIVAMACRFPEADSLDKYWELLSKKENSISKTYLRPNIDTFGGYIKDYDQFDPQFFGISTREAINIDPQQRLLLEVTYEALENAHLTTEKLSGSATGVFMGISSQDYAQLQMKHGWNVNVYSGTGNSSAIASNRISYNFNLTGPSLSVDTACSSSLVAVHLAVNSLKSGECDCAIVGGVNLILAPELTETFQKAGMMAEDGKCKTFSEDADGYGRGEGCGVVILKPLSKALADGDKVLAVIHGSAINQDGRSNGLTAPSGKAQQRVIQSAWKNASITPDKINYIEAHGTGTPLGDPIEVNSLAGLLPFDGQKTVNSSFVMDENEEKTSSDGVVNGKEEKTSSNGVQKESSVIVDDSSMEKETRGKDYPICWLGSAKTNIGHLEAAAGIAGLIKTVLMLNHEEIPPIVNFKKLNPYINLNKSRLQIATKSVEWKKSSQPRFAGVSSFGFGGTNAHVIVGDMMDSSVNITEEEVKVKEEIQRPYHLLTLSATTEKALQDVVNRYQDYLTKAQGDDVSHICYSTNQGRSHFNHRLAIGAKDKTELVEKLATLTINQNNQINNNQIAFLFTGQGSQYCNMGKELYQTAPLFQDTVNYCSEILSQYLEKPLTEIIFNPEEKETLHQTIYTQPAIFVIEYALAQLWLSWGIKPSVMMGHSVGEYVAATLAGVFSLEDALKLIAHRGKLMQQLPLDGGMVCLFTNLDTAQKLITQTGLPLDIAAINSDSNIVVSGKKEDLQQLQTTAKGSKVKCRHLKVSHGFHSRLMQPILADFDKIAQEITYNSPQGEIISNITGKTIGEEIASPDYWVKHISHPVNFAQSVEYLQQQNYQIFLEIGSKPTLLGMARMIVENKTESDDCLWLPSLRKGESDWENLLNSLGILYQQGLKIDWDGFHQDYPSLERVSLPNYPWQHQRYWHGDSLENTVDDGKQWLYEVAWEKDSSTFLNNPEKSLPKSLSNGYLIFVDEKKVGETWAKELTSQGSQVYLVYKGESYRQEENTYYINPEKKKDYQLLLDSLDNRVEKIIYGWAINEDDDLNHINQLTSNNYLDCLPVIYLIQSLVNSNHQVKLWLITQNSQWVMPQEKVNPYGGSIWGLGKVIALEHSEYWGGMIDMDNQGVSLSLLTYLVNDKLDETMAAIRDKSVYYCRLQHKTADNFGESKTVSIKSSGSYLITGGLGALGLETANYLISQGAKNLILVSRSQPSSSISQKINQWEEEGINVMVKQGDVTNKESLRNIFHGSNKSFPPLKGIIHTAGVLDDSILATLSPEKLTRVMESKVIGVNNLHQLTLDNSLDFFILYSSVASMVGSIGQGNYAMANSYLDSFASYRQSLGLPAISINWGAFSVGMAKATEDSLKAVGIETIPPEKGIAMVGDVINYANAGVGVIKFNWDTVARKFPQLSQSPYLQRVVSSSLKTEDGKKDDSQTELFNQLLKADGSGRITLLIDYLIGAIALILHIEKETIKPEDSLMDLGMDSLMVMEAINHLKTDLQLMLYPREIYERPQISTLAQYLAQEFATSHDSNAHKIKAPSQKGIIVSPSNEKEEEKPTFNPTNHQPIAFILSSPRSGSTLLRVMLAGHPDLVSPPELHLLPFATMQERQKELESSHLGEGLIRTVMDLKQISVEESEGLVNQWIEENLTIAQVYEILQTLGENCILIDKSPTYANSKSTLYNAENIFSQAKYIHLVRHPYSVIESFARMRMDKLLDIKEVNPYEIGESIWYQSNQNIVNFAKKIDGNKILTIYYENLVTSPEKEMEKITNFLGIKFNKSLLNPYEGERMTTGLYKQSMSVGDPNFNSRQKIDPNLANHWKEVQLPILLNPLTKLLSEQFDYQLPHESKIIKTQEKYLKIRGLNLCYCSWGNENNPPLFIVHGILDQGFAWEKVAQNLAQNGYYVIAPDMRGHGKSDHNSLGCAYNLLDFVADLDCLINELGNEEKVTLLGHSFGSMITGIYTSMRPEKIDNLYLIEPILPTKNKDNQDIENISSQLNNLLNVPPLPVFDTVEVVAQRLQKTAPNIDDDFALKLAQRMTKSVEGGVTFTYSPMLATRVGVGFNSIPRNQYLQLLSSITVPITLVYGDNSSFNRPQDLEAQKAAMVNGQIFTIKGGHNLHLENPLGLGDVLINP
ncbi:MAG: alpha/beta fold hydrolase [Cyanobacterium sp.]